MVTMKYINMDDLTTVIQNRLLVESIEKDEEILNGIEDLVISEVSAYIGGRYDVKKIFGDPPIRTGLLVRVITCITAYRAISRNSARKVGNNPLSDMNDWADLILGKLRDGIMPLPPEIPLITDEEGNAESPILFGHTRNSGWFL